MIASMIVSDRYGAAKSATLHDCPVAAWVSTGLLSGDLSFQPADVIAGMNAAMQWKRNNPNATTIINLSFGSAGTNTYPDTTSSLALAIKAATDAGIVVTVSAGNNGMDACTHTLGAIPYATFVVGGTSPPPALCWRKICL